MAHTAQQITEAVERIMAADDFDPAELWNRIAVELPGIHPSQERPGFGWSDAVVTREILSKADRAGRRFRPIPIGQVNPSLSQSRGNDHVVRRP